MLNSDRKAELIHWFNSNGVPQCKQDYLISAIESHCLIKKDRRDEIDCLTNVEQLASNISVLVQNLPVSLRYELDTSVEDIILREQWDEYRTSPKDRLEPRHLGDIDLKMYLSSIVTACKGIKKNKPAIDDPHTYRILIWLCNSIAHDFHIRLNDTKIINFICAYTGKDFEAVKKQHSRLKKKGKIHKYEKGTFF